jgi:hypothetical protein
MCGSQTNNRSQIPNIKFQILNTKHQILEKLVIFSNLIAADNTKEAANNKATTHQNIGGEQHQNKVVATHCYSKPKLYNSLTKPFGKKI